MDNNSTDNRHFSEDSFSRNTPLQLVLGIASVYIVFQIVVLVLMIVSDAPKSIYFTHIVPYTGIFDWDLMLERPYSLLTYTYCNREFLVLFANCIWLYVCAKSIASRYHFQEVIPSYLIISISSAIIYLIGLKLFNIQPESYNTGAFSSLMAMSVTMLGKKGHVFKINNNIQVSYIYLFIIILFFSSIQYNISSPQVWVLIISSYLTGFIYFYLVGKYQIGRKIYAWIKRISKSLTPQFKEEDILGWDIDELFRQIKEKHPQIQESKLDDMFSKIKKDGFKSLTDLEKKIFFRLMHD